MNSEVRSRRPTHVGNRTPRSRQGAARSVLDGTSLVVGEEPSLPTRICAQHLALLGANVAVQRAGKRDGALACLSVGKSPVQPETHHVTILSPGERVECAIQCEAEVIAQAASGMMALHGRDRQIPRRLGLEVVSVAAGMLASQGMLAALIARSRGRNVRRVETSTLQASLLFLAHHLAMGTCAGRAPLMPRESAPGPPFHTADGHWIEIEALSFDAWNDFWSQLGVASDELGVAWANFVFRYLTASCTLPVALHEAAARQTLAQLADLAGRCGVALCRVRTYPELLAEFGWSEPSERLDVGVELPPGIPWLIWPGIGRSDHPLASLPLGDAPLSGVRVVEVTSRLQGPLAGLLLQMLGAEVIKVEPPGGDIGKHAPPLAGALSAAYLAYNRGKQVVEIDYKRPAGRNQIAELAADADVFLHNWRTGRAETLSLDFPDLVRTNPALVYAHASGWGRTEDEPSPIAGDYLVQAHAGCGDGLNPIGEPPFPSRLTLVDVTGGLLACEAILAGLYLRERTGQGCRVDTSLLGAATTLQAHVLAAAAMGQEDGRYLGRTRWSALERPIATADGYIVVIADDDLTRNRLRDICGVEPAMNGTDVEHVIINELRNYPTAEWESRLLDAGLPAVGVRTDLAEHSHDARVAAFLERINDACWAPAAPWQFAS